jgi:phosphoenolpyruvate-protein phosphotransferase (PTS system enzyme I)
MQSASLLRVKREILGCDVASLRPRVARLVSSDDPIKVRAALDRLRGP